MVKKITNLSVVKDIHILLPILEKNKSTILENWYMIQFDSELIEQYQISDIPNLDKNWLVNNYLSPLFDLLTSYIRTGETTYKDVYLDERIRYVPYLSLDQKEFFQKILSSEESFICTKFDPNNRMAKQFKLLWRELHFHLTSGSQGDPLKVLAIGDCIMNEIRVFLSSLCRTNDINLDMRFLYFSASQQSALSTDQAIDFLNNNPTDLVTLSFFTYSGLPFYSILMNQPDKIPWDETKKQVNSMMGIIRNFLNQIREVTDVPFLIHNVGGLLINNEGGYFINKARRYFPFLSPISAIQKRILDYINDQIDELLETTPNMFIIDEKNIVISNGYNKCLKQVFSKFKYRNALFHTCYFGYYLSKKYNDVILSYRDLHKAKVLLLDFDNTLWEGVMADGSVHQHENIQKLLKRVKEGGIVLVAVSKNDPKNIRWEEMVLQPSDFVLLKINWNLKVQSIEETATDLNLGLDSFVFIDDNPVERELVKTNLPAVKVLDALSAETWLSIERMLNFSNTSDTDEAQKRTDMYRGQMDRKEVLNKDYDYPAMMSTLELKATFGLAKKKNLSRLNELVNRTNQFNTTTIRYSKTELQDLFENDNYRIYITELSDKFSDLGIVGAVIIERKEDTAIFNSFIMSCRAMGFGLEQLMLRLVLDTEKKAKKYVGRFFSTDRNDPAKDLYSRNGFQFLSDEEWKLEDKNAFPDRPPWFDTKLDAKL